MQTAKPLAAGESPTLTSVAVVVGETVNLTDTIVIDALRSEGQSVHSRAREFEPYIIESANRYGIDARILRIVCFMESRFRVNAVSAKGALGPMQFIPETARRYGLRNPFDPRASIDAAAHYLHDLLKRFGGRVDLALAAYNAGEGAVESFRTGRALLLASGKMINPRRLVTGGVPPYRETRAYVRSGMSLMSGLLMITAKDSEGRHVGPTAVHVVDRGDFTLDVTDTKFLRSLQGKDQARSFFIDVP
jgi:hypothetical protein